MSEARKQQGFRQAEASIVTDILESEGEYYKDNFGNMIPGGLPARRAMRLPGAARLRS